jgi:hypothetical protein
VTSAVTRWLLCGLALARFLFELDPLRFAFLGAWPGALGLAFLGALLGLGLGLALAARRPAANDWAGLALLLPLVAVLAPGVNPLRTATLLAGSLVLFVLLAFPAPQPPGVARTRLFSLSLFLFLFFLYLSGLAPAVGEADTFEFQVACLSAARWPSAPTSPRPSSAPCPASARCCWRGG